MNIEGKECTNCLNNCCFNCFKDGGGTELFLSLSHEELDVLMEDKAEVQFKPGETILKQNTSSTHVICIKKGLAKVFVEGVKGKSLILKMIGKNDFIIGGGLFANRVRYFTVSAINDVRCCFINSEKLIELFKTNSNFATEILKHNNNQNSEILDKLVKLTQKYMPGRVADTLLYLKNEVFKTNPFPVPITRQELADMSAMTKESYVRILKEFKSSGIVEPNGNSIEITDEEALTEISRNG